jgi:hypothetical protein
MPKLLLHDDSVSHQGGMMPTIKEVLEVVHDMRDIFTPRKMLQRWYNEEHQDFLVLKKRVAKIASAIWYTDEVKCPACSKESSYLLFVGDAAGVCSTCFFTVFREVFAEELEEARAQRKA